MCSMPRLYNKSRELQKVERELELGAVSVKRIVEDLEVSLWRLNVQFDDSSLCVIVTVIFRVL
jgi:hypothetical protein